MRRFANLFFIFLLSVLSACGPAPSDSEPPSPTPAPLPIRVGTIKGTAFAVDTAAPLANVKVSVGSISATTANDGSFTLNNVLEQERAVVKYEATDYAPAFSAVPVVNNQTSATQGLLSKVGATSTFAANAASTLTVPNSPAQVALTADSLVNAATGAAPSGAITAQITPIDPASNPQSMPGDYTSLTATGAVQSIESFGAVNVELKDAAGNKLNLAQGKSATIRIPVSSRTAAANNPATIPLYYFNETNGRWIQEGTATLSADKQYYEGTVTHFSTWNCDRPIEETIYVNGCLVDKAGKSVANASYVDSQGIDYSGSARTTTDAQGKFRVAMKKNGVATVGAHVSTVDGGYLDSPRVQVGPSAIDITLLACLVLSDTVTYAVPEIYSDPRDVKVIAGTAATFYVYAHCTSLMRYQWYRNGVLITGATQYSYTLSNPLVSDNSAVFTVVITSPGGSITSAPATLTVLAAPVAPKITSQPKNITVATGEPASFAVTADGFPAPTYQWYRNGTAIVDAVFASYSLPTTAASDNGAQFYVVATNAGGSATSSTVTLTLVAPSLPVITAQPASKTVFEGQAASFSVTATSLVPVTAQWYRNGTLIASATNLFYTTPITTLADNGAVYSVVLTNSVGSVTSANATLTVQVVTLPPAITKQPAPVLTVAGTPAAFSVTATNPPLTYQWRRNGTVIAGATNATYSIASVALSDSGAVFSVIVTNAAGSVTSSNAALTVSVPLIPVFDRQPVSQTVLAGKSATFLVGASGAPNPTFQWYRNGVLIPNAISPIYTTPVTSIADNGAVYSVKATNSAGTVTSDNATLTVTPVTLAPVITQQPQGVTVYQGDPGYFGVSANEPSLNQYQWRRNGLEIPGAATSFYITPATTAADNGAKFSVVVTNAAGSVTSSEAVLTVRSTTNVQRDAFIKMVFLPFSFAGNIGAADELIEDKLFISPLSLCTGGGNIAATFDGAALPAVGSPLTSGSHTLAATFNSCVNTSNRTTQTGNSTFTYNFTDALLLNGSSAVSGVNMRVSELDSAGAVFSDTTANGSASATSTGSLAGTVETRNTSFSIASGATHKNNLNGNLATFTSGSVTANQVEELAPASPTDNPLLRDRLAFNSLAYTIGTVNYVVNGLIDSVQDPITKITAHSGEITLTANGVQAGRWYYVNNAFVIEVTNLPQPFGIQQPSRKLFGRVAPKF